MGQTHSPYPAAMSLHREYLALRGNHLSDALPHLFVRGGWMMFPTDNQVHLIPHPSPNKGGLRCPSAREKELAGVLVGVCGLCWLSVTKRALSIVQARSPILWFNVAHLLPVQSSQTSPKSGLSSSQILSIFRSFRESSSPQFLSPSPLSDPPDRGEK